MPVYDNQGHWDSDVPMDPGKYFGFVYLITNLINHKKYIGKKQYVHGGKTYHKKADGKKQTNYRKGVQTDWRTYTGSSKDLNADIEALGVDNFSFEVICEYKTKGMLHYAEVMLQNDVQVLAAKLPDGTREYYNRSTAAMKFLPPDEVSDETRAKIRQASLAQWADKDKAQRCKDAQDAWRENNQEIFKETSMKGSISGGITRGKQLATPVIGTKDNKDYYFDSMTDAARQTDNDQGNISNAINGKRKTAKGYTWRYADPDYIPELITKRTNK